MDDADEAEPARPEKAGRGGPLQRVAAIAIGTVLALLGAELVMHVPGLPLPRDLSTYLFQCYYPSYEPDRILFENERLYINLHKPNFQAKCHWNGYSWRHRSDAWGGRNPESWSKVDVVLLGDSMIYGHGVEEEDTMAHKLRERLGVRVANLAVMGDSVPQYMARLRNFALPLRPRVVFVFLFGGNDISDLIQTRPPRMMRRFISRGDAPEAGIFPRDLLLGSVPSKTGFGQLVEHQALLYRTARFYLLKGEKKPAPMVASDFPEDTAPPNGPPPGDLRPRERLAIRYLEAALTLMRDSAKAANTELVLVFLPGLSQGDSREDRLVFNQARLQASELGLHFLDATPVQYANGHPIPGARLAYDGHLSPSGHTALAALLADYIERNRLLAEEPR